MCWCFAVFWGFDPCKARYVDCFGLCMFDGLRAKALPVGRGRGCVVAYGCAGLVILHCRVVGVPLLHCTVAAFITFEHL